MSDDMTAKVAAAIKKAGDAQSEYYWNDMGYADLARAALQAMREPTEAMLCPEGEDERIPFFDFHRQDDAAGIWRAMIDAALGEKPDAPK